MSRREAGRPVLRIERLAGVCKFLACTQNVMAALGILANFFENCSEAVGQQREIQNCASLLVQLSTIFLYARPIGRALWLPQILL